MAADLVHDGSVVRSSSHGACSQSTCVPTSQNEVFSGGYCREDSSQTTAEACGKHRPASLGQRRSQPDLTFAFQLADLLVERLVHVERACARHATA